MTFEHQPRQRRSARTPAGALAAHLIGYVVAWALLLGLALAACNAMIGPAGPATAPGATVTPYVQPSAARTPAPKHTTAPKRTPLPSYDLNLATVDCDPNDPQMDPTVDEECPLP